MSAHEVAERYTAFADAEAAGLSPLYESLARAVAADERLCDSIAGLPQRCHQPNLFLAAVRFVTGTAPADGLDLAARVSVHWDEIREVMLSRFTQTNEPGRCAALLLGLQEIHEPVSLFEVGASAGLCLLPDRYRYRYHGADHAVLGSGSCELDCELQPGLEPPRRIPEIAWRAGLDQNPLDVTDTSDVEWLRSLVWPDMPGRAARLDSALDVARTDPPRVQPGDLVADLPDLLRQTPEGTTPVVLHSAVLAYVAPETRREFLAVLRDFGAVRIGLEPPRSSPAYDSADSASGSCWGTEFVVDLDGRILASGAPHGSWVGPLL